MFEQVYRIGDMQEVATNEAVNEAEAALHTRFPHGYREYVTTLGDGDYNTRVHVLPPSEVLAEYRPQQETWADNPGLYDEYFTVIPHNRFLHMILFLITDDGVNVVFHPDAPDDLYLLEEQAAYKIGGSLGDALDWIFGTGIATPKVQRSILTTAGTFVAHDFRFFEPSTGRATTGLAGPNLDAYHRAKDLLIGLALADREGMTCVYHEEEEIEGGRYEWLQLLVREYAGNIECSAILPRGSTKIGITYDERHETTSIEHLRSSLQRVGYR